jgi:hypothetical protein
MELNIISNANYTQVYVEFRMRLTEKKIRSELNWKNILFNSLGFITVLSFLLFLRAPILINADNYLNFDEAYQGSQIMDLLNGAPVHFYYEGVSYAGIPLGLAAAPFFFMFGVSAFAYKIPAVIAYALYIVTFYWVVKKINPPAALTVVLLMIFSPTSALYISTYNWQHNLIIFLGGIIFLLFFKIKESITPRSSTVFLFGLVMGFSIYTYTYSILYIASVAIMFVLTHDGCSSFREKISITLLIDWWYVQLSGKMKLVRVVDIVIICFLMAILFSYVFGGFGIDIFGYSLFQINNLHKPVFQVLAIIAIRFLMYREDIKSGLGGVRNFINFQKTLPTGRFIFLGIIGFILGILPRILSIVTGEVTRGGQGFDVDFNPIKLIVHLWELISYYIPQFFDIREPIRALFSSEWSSWIILRAGLAIVVSLLILMAIFNFLSSSKLEIKKMVQFKRLEYFPDLIFVVFSILLFSAVIVSQHGALIRYLLPLHGVVSICVAIYLNKIRSVSKVRFAFLLLVWCGFSLVNTYSSYIETPDSNKVVMRGFSVVKHDSNYDELLEYCDSKKIKHVYSDRRLAAQINFLSKGNIIAGVYDQNKNISRKNQILSLKKSFSIIISNNNEHHLKTYKTFLDEKTLKFSKELVDNKFWVLTNFVGDPADVDRLRHLMPINF